MRIRKRQVPLPLSSLLPVPLSDLYFNRSPSATTPYFCGGGGADGVGGGVAGGAAFPISDGLIQTDLVMDKNKKDDADDGDVKTSIDASDSKNNVDPRAESGSLTQVVEEKEKVVSLRKRRSYRSFEEEEDEYEEEEEEASTRSKKGKKRAKKNGMLEEGSRCSRVNGRGWRCCQQTLVGYSLCEHHLGKGRVRSMNKSKGGLEKKAAVVVEVKKKRVKLGMVKARSINSLLGQTSSSNVVVDAAAGTATATESEIIALPDQFAA